MTSPIPFSRRFAGARAIIAGVLISFIGSSARADITNGLVLNLTMDESTGLVAHDSTTNHLDGTLVNFPGDNSEWQTGLISNGLAYNSGQVQYVTNSGPALNAVITNTTFTLAVWVRATNLVAGTAILAKGTGGGHETFVIDVNANHWRFFVRNTAAAATQLNPTTLTNGNWTHLAAVFNRVGGIMQFYINGTLAASGAPPTTLWTDAHEMSIGNRQGSTGPYNEPAFGGMIDDVRVYSRALSASDIAELFNAGGHAWSAVAFTSSPINGTRYAGDTFNIPAQTVTAANPLYPTAPVTYQWYHVDTNNVTNLVANATNSSLTLTNLQLSDDGSYFLMAGNLGGTTNSASGFLTVSPLPAPDILTGLNAYWNFDETSGTTAADSSGNGNTGTLVGLPGDSSTWVPGIVNNAIYCSGANEYVSVADAPALNFGTNNPVAFSLSAWVKSALNATGSGSQVDGAGILAKGYGGGGEIFAFDVHLGNYRFYVRSANNGAGTSAITSVPCLSNIWEHIVATVDLTNNIMNVYVNGQLSLSILPPATLNTNNHPLTIGAREGGPATGYNLPFIGTIDDVRVYDRALNAADVSALYAMGGVSAPSVTVQPSGSSNSVGDSVSIIAGVNGTAPIFYQWAFNGTNIPGANNFTLTLTNLQTTNAGTYTLFASNAYGFVDSSNAVVQVTPFNFAATAAYYAFDDGNGYTAADSSGNGNNGTLNGFPDSTSQWGPGRIGGALSFNSDGFNTEYVEAPDSPTIEFDQPNAMTVSLWARGSATQVNGAGLVAKGGAASSVQFGFDVFNGAYRFFVRNGSGVGVAVQSAIAPDNRWQFVTGTYSGAASSLKIYVNGVLAGSATGPTTLQLSSSPLSIGSRFSGTAGYDLPFAGVLDDVRLYNRALSAAQVAQLYSAAPPLTAVIYTQPAGATLYDGQSAVFNVQGDGTDPLSYQWQKNNANIPGATGQTLTLNNLQSGDAGTYRVLLTDATSSVYSSNAVLQLLANPAPDITNGLVAYWNFDETNGLGAADSSGNGNSASLYGFANDDSQWVPGVIGGALQFDSSGGDYALTDNPLNGLTDANLFSFAFWAKENAGAQGADPRFISPAGGHSWVAWDRGNGGVGFLPAAPSTQPSAAAWHHFVVDYDRGASTYSVYVDGVLRQASVPTSPSDDPTSMQWIIGHSESPLDGTESWNGLLDDMRIYNGRLLQINDAKALYYLGTPPQIGAAQSGSNLTVSWPAGALGYHLQKSVDLSDPLSWTNVTTPAVTSADGLTQSVTDGVAGDAAFYRLVNH